MVMRFAMAAHACMSRLMSDDRIVPDMEQVIMLYLDTMVEMDRWIMQSKAKKKQTHSNEEGADDTEASTMNHPSPDVGGGNKNRRRKNNQPNKRRRTTPSTGGEEKKTRGRNSFGKKPSFTKSNSLGLLKAGRDHNYFGPAKLHWEGGWAGERKITGAKKWMGIKRANADWPTISLRRMYQMESLGRLQEKLEGEKESRDVEMSIYVYKTKAKATEAVAENMPLAGIVDKNGLLWIACRPCDGDSKKRSHILLLQVQFDDEAGEVVGDMCYCAPLGMDIEKSNYPCSSARELDSFADQYVLFLPLLDEKGTAYQNSYYAIGNKWTERVPSGDFLLSELSKKVFQSWI
jgi:hypothetical protein